MDETVGQRLRQAIAMRGHGWRYLPDEMWRELPDELMAAEPAFIYLPRFDHRLLKRREPRLLQALRASYWPESGNWSGRWWVKKSLVDEPQLRRRVGGRKRPRDPSD